MSAIKYSTDAELQSARNSSRTRRHVPAVASSLGTSPRRAENPTSPTVGSTCDVRRETNLRTCLGEASLPRTLLVASVFGFRLAILKRAHEKRNDRRWIWDKLSALAYSIIGIGCGRRWARNVWKIPLRIFYRWFLFFVFVFVLALSLIFRVSA